MLRQRPGQSGPARRAAVLLALLAGPALAGGAAGLPALRGLSPGAVFAAFEAYPQNFAFGTPQGLGNGWGRRCGHRDVRAAYLRVCVTYAGEQVGAVEATVVSGVTDAGTTLLERVASLPFAGNDARASLAWLREYLPAARNVREERAGAVWELQGRPSDAGKLALRIGVPGVGAP